MVEIALIAGCLAALVTAIKITGNSVLQGLRLVIRDEMSWVHTKMNEVEDTLEDHTVTLTEHDERIGRLEAKC